MDFFAHTENSSGDWHKLAEHLSSVGQLAAEFAAQMNPEFAEPARWAGLLHDLGKYRDEFQQYLRKERPGSHQTHHAIYGAALAFNHRNLALAASVNPTGFVSPGTDLVYTFSFSNGGAGSASTYVITDPIPANTDFKLGSVTTSLGTTGLTSTVAYSNNGGSTWTYSPVSTTGGAPAGYDRTVTGVRWSFGSTLSQTSPNNAGSVGLTARVR